MTDDISLFRFDIDGEAMRALLEALGVPPAALDELATEAGEGSADSSSQSPPSRERTGPRTGETPPPGAGEQVPPSAADEDGDSRKRLLLLAGGGAALLATLAGIGAVLYRRRSPSGDLPIPDIDTPSPDLDLPGPDLDRVTSLVGSGADGDDTADAEPEPTTERERTESRVDTAPLIGMAALAVGAVVVRLSRSTDE